MSAIKWQIKCDMAQKCPSQPQIMETISTDFAYESLFEMFDLY